MTDDNILIMINPEEIKDRILLMMDELQLNAAAFADKADISRSVLSNVINQKSNVTIDTLNKILSAYPDWSKAWLIFGEGFPRTTLSQNTESPSLIEESSLFHTNLSTSEDHPHQPLYTTTKEELIGVVKEAYFSLKENETKKADRKIQEIRVFYDDGSFEIFTHSKP